ncbi:hypothetical protein H8A95_23185 [Bradyrhizobium sp. Pear76]|uniref:hypothetical protein n=1 Tax=Bradyrhizobium oropedii TaxID=1571201 RepID=UPI001E374AB7|nr:hypothetical protein [Bradyrhizobium oropedii]MCC8965139.1 hypothetical protein [Bradyrhizobium oropedii]
MALSLFKKFRTLDSFLRVSMRMRITAPPHRLVFVERSDCRMKNYGRIPRFMMHNGRVRETSFAEGGSSVSPHSRLAQAGLHEPEAQQVWSSAITVPMLLVTEVQMLGGVRIQKAVSSQSMER